MKIEVKVLVVKKMGKVEETMILGDIEGLVGIGIDNIGLDEDSIELLTEEFEDNINITDEDILINGLYPSDLVGTYGVINISIIATEIDLEI